MTDLDTHAAHMAEIYARVTGSIGATYTVERRNLDGSLETLASATFTRPPSADERLFADARLTPSHAPEPLYARHIVDGQPYGLIPAAPYDDALPALENGAESVYLALDTRDYGTTPEDAFCDWEDSMIAHAMGEDGE